MLHRYCQSLDSHEVPACEYNINVKYKHRVKHSGVEGSFQAEAGNECCPAQHFFAAQVAHFCAASHFSAASFALAAVLNSRFGPYPNVLEPDAADLERYWDLDASCETAALIVFVC